MANEAYLNKGTELSINGEVGADEPWSVEGLASGSLQISDQITLAAAPRPDEFEWSCEVQFQATPTIDTTLDLYIATAPDSDSTQIDGDLGATDATKSASTDITARKNMTYIGSVTVENAAASEKNVASGRFRCTQRYLSLVAYNGTGAAVNATDSNFQFKLRPIYYQGQ